MAPRGGALFLISNMPIRPYLDGHTFDAETVRLLRADFEIAIAALRTWEVPSPPREAIAKALIVLAKGGARDPERLCEAALKACPPVIVSDPNPLPPHRRILCVLKLRPVG